MTIQTILLVEDSPDDVFLVRRSLQEKFGQIFQIVHKATMAEAEVYAQEHKDDISVILLDLHLPDTGDGRHTFERMQKLAHHIPIVVLTSMEDHALAVSLVGNGAEDFVNKNTVHEKPELLRNAIDFAVSRHQLMKTHDKKHQENLEEKDTVIAWMGGGYSVGQDEPV